MIGKPLFHFALLVGSLFGASASAVTTSKNVDIVVTHGAPLTTFTFVNNTGAALSAGTPVSMGQAFRYGDIMPGNYPVIRDATTHIALPGQQWDEISTWRENGGNGSWRHAVWAIQLPASLSAGATYRIEFVPQSGVYSQSSHQSLSTLCSGVSGNGAHDFKILLNDVRNQDDTTRDSGSATFRVCDNIANSGRDAPRHLRAGSVYDEYEVSGLFAYATSGHKDPLLYAQCVIDLFTDPADGTSLKDVRHVCTVHNSWMNVAAGSAGNTGNPGPAGFTNDPQVVSYQPQILDGATDILDWSGLTQTVASSSSPVGSNCSDTYQGSTTLTIPGSTGNNTWFSGMPVRYSTTGTALGGLTPGHLYWVYNCGVTTSGGATTQHSSLMNSPLINSQVTLPLTSTSQGTGNHTFTFVMWHPHAQAWVDEDTSADENWATRGSTARFTRRIYPAFTSAEKLYWEETGLVPPINTSQPTPTVQMSYGGSDGILAYNPFSKMNVVGGDQGGERPDIGLITEWQAQAWVTGTQTNWYNSRLFTMASDFHGPSTVLDEATGRIPVLNNGPPTGPGGNGVGGTYGSGTNSAVALGTPNTTVSWFPYTNIANPLQNVPNSLVDWRVGIYAGTSYAHIPNFVSLSYLFFGERTFLEMSYTNAQRTLLTVATGPGPGGRDSLRDNILTGPNGTNHYWGITIACCQARGSAWMLRDRVFPAALGGDGNIERQYFNDQITENLNYYQVWVNPYKDGATTNIENSIQGPDYPGSWGIPDTFVGNYIFLTTYEMQSYLHALGTTGSTHWKLWVSPVTRFYEGVCGMTATGHPNSAYYCIDFTIQQANQNGDATMWGANVGPAVNGTDVSSFGNLQNGTNFLAGGQMQYASGFGYYTLAPGDTVRSVNNSYTNDGTFVDQLPGTQWFQVIGPVNNTTGTYYIQCPVGHAVTSTCPTPGQAFTGFTMNGTSLTGTQQWQILYRPSYDPGAGSGYVDNNYTKYGGQVMNGLTVMGENVADGFAIFNSAARNGPAYYSTSFPSVWWDSTVVVPGIH